MNAFRSPASDSFLARAACAALALFAYASPSHALTPLSQVAAGGDTTCAIYLGGAYCWGANANGQVGNNTKTMALSPAAVVGLDAGVTAITTGGAHSCAVVNGGAWCWGNNDYGQLGNNAGADSPVPVPVTGLASGVTAISAGDLHTCAVVNGGAKCWGSGGYGQLGNGATTFSTAVPVDVVNLGAGIEEVSAGTNHTCASGSGFGYCWGRGDSGEVGSGGSTFINPNPANVSGFGGIFSNIVSTIDGGGAFSCGVQDGSAYCWGLGGNGQIGNGFSNNAPVPQPLSTSMTGVTEISAGTGLHACAVAGGAAICWGANNQGQLGNPSFPGGSNVPVAVQGLASGVQRIAAGGLHTCAITDAGLSCWGGNANGQLGTGGQVPSPTPVLIFPAAVATDLVASPATLDFGGQSVGTSTPAQVVTITNNGATSVTFTNSAISAGFDGATACATLVPGASCTLSIRFTPQGAGARTGYAILETSAGLVGVDLAGVGELSLVTLVNISTRGQILTGFDVMIGGFVISGPSPKKVVVRAIGPSLAGFGVAGTIADPTLSLTKSDGTPVASNDNWQTQANPADVTSITNAGFAPTSPFESAIITTLNPGAYTAIVSGMNGSTGVGLVEVYEVDHPETNMINISTRGRVSTGGNVMIGGFVVSGSGPQSVVVRAIGPSLAAFGVSTAMTNPTLAVTKVDGTPIASNDDWQADVNASQVSLAGFAPSDTRESALFLTLQPGAYTVIVSGAGGTSGTGLVEVYTTP